MNYLFIGEEHYLLNQKISAIVNDKKVNNMNIVSYDMSKESFVTLISDCNTLPFFSECKIVIARNCNFLGSGGAIEQEDILLDYIHHAMETTVLILVYEGKVDARKKLVKELKKHCEVFTFNTLDEYDRDMLVNTELKKRDIVLDQKTKALFLNRCGFDMMKIMIELDKLATYGEAITIPVIAALVDKPIEDNVFHLMQALFDKNIKVCFSYVEDFKKLNVEVIALIGMLASQFRFLSEVKVLSMMYKGKQEIANELNAHPYRVEKTLQQAYRYDLKQMQGILNDLALLDQRIKSGAIDKNLGFEVLLLKICA